MDRIAVQRLALALLVSVAVDPGSRLAAGDIDRYRAHYLSASDGVPKDGAVKVTFLGTTTLLFDDGETQLMTDGFFSRPSLLKVTTSKIQTDTRVVDAVLKRARVERLKALFVAHSHYDHA